MREHRRDTVIAGTMALIVASIIVYLVQSWSRVRAVTAEEAEQI
jgi:hypothetical protein